MNNLLKSLILFLFWLIIVSTTGCDNTEDTLKGGRDTVVRVKIRSIIKKPRTCWENVNEGRVFILAMGSEMGDTEENRRKHANKDAEHFAEAMRGLFGLRKDGFWRRVFGLPDESRVCVLKNVTKAEFVHALKRLKRLVTPDDLVIIFYSGHSAQGEDDNEDERDGYDEFFVTYSEQVDNESWLRDDDFSRLIKNINTHNILTVIDACFSAGFMKGERSSELVKRWSKLRTRFPPSGATLDPVKSVLLSAATEFQEAVELNKWCTKTKKPEKYRGGRFTVFFLEVLKRAMQKSKPVDLREVFEETKEKVTKHSERCSNTPQVPVKNGDDELFKRINSYIPQQ